MQNTELLAEIERLKEQFKNADESKLNAMDCLINQAAYETLYLKKLNEQALNSGLIKIHPNNPDVQKTLPVSTEISKHSASLTNIIDKLCKHLCLDNEEEDESLNEYE